MSSRISFHRRTTGAALLTVLLGACTSQPPQPATVESTEEVSATVEAIDVQKRLLSLVGPDGEKITVEVAPQVRNLPQVKVGDRVVARYYKALAAELRSRGDGTGSTQAPVYEATASRAAEGERPAAMVGAQSRQTVRVTSVDTKNNVVNFYGSDGLARSVPVSSPQGKEFISKLKAGDEVELTYTEAVALSVEPAK
ncbi:MAG TPA: hypothetical protein VJT10_06150 [Steroidobacteraceae bacterium]|jgi:hypothetical protein|nr:hypothetical protein [Steroidobacteraceae bacterium]